ncbi:hypothetical protein ACH4FX_05980 [Streptomyces sp. NPDC018019]|uniref:hypothetical protein n=1 Tax=Streptomyces sp. NPDC018019 TaxID=3365030 RepID=UPI0037AD5B97
MSRGPFSAAALASGDPSGAPPGGGSEPRASVRRRRRPFTSVPLVLSLLSLLFTGACVSQPSDPAGKPSDHINAPLPRKSRADALAWAKSYTSTMAHYADVKIADDLGPFTDFEACVGKNDEVADDGRFSLTYTVYAHLPREQHIAAVRKLRTALKDHGVDVTDYTEEAEAHKVTLYGKQRTEKFLIIADTVKPPNTLRLSVSTSCFLPPDAKQQQF